MILTELMAPYLHAPTLLMGDLNMGCVKEPEHCQEYQLLSQPGWQLAVKEQYLINQIWTAITDFDKAFSFVYRYYNLSYLQGFSRFIYDPTDPGTDQNLKRPLYSR